MTQRMGSITNVGGVSLPGSDLLVLLIQTIRVTKCIARGTYFKTPRNEVLTDVLHKLYAGLQQSKLGGTIPNKQHTRAVTLSAKWQECTSEV